MGSSVIALSSQQRLEHQPSALAVVPSDQRDLGATGLCARRRANQYAGAARDGCRSRHPAIHGGRDIYRGLGKNGRAALEPDRARRHLYRVGRRLERAWARAIGHASPRCAPSAGAGASACGGYPRGSIDQWAPIGRKLDALCGVGIDRDLGACSRGRSCKRKDDRAHATGWGPIGPGVKSHLGRTTAGPCYFNAFAAAGVRHGAL